MQRVAIFPGSFDPFTRGHEAIVNEALRLFDKVVIAMKETGDDMSPAYKETSEAGLAKIAVE